MIDIRSACITHTRTHTHSYLIPSFNFDDMVVISHCLNRFVVPPCQLLTSVPLYGDIYCLRFYLRLTDFLLVSISILFLRIFHKNREQFMDYLLEIIAWQKWAWICSTASEVSDLFNYARVRNCDIP